MFSLEYLRQFRVTGYAWFDLIAAFLGMLLLSPLLSNGARHIRLSIPRRNWVFLTLPIGILAHMLVGNYTPMTREFLSLDGPILLKLVVLISCILGAYGIRIIRPVKVLDEK